MRTENRSLTPTLAEVLQTAIDANLIDIHVCLPAKIVDYDAATQTASLLPSLLQTYEDDTVLPWPVVPNVPIIFPRAAAGQAYLHMPLIPGDDVVIIVCERSLDNWKETGLLSDPDDRRQFDMTDAFAVPGGSAGPLAFNVSNPQAVTLKNLLSSIEMTPTGQYKIKGGFNDELISVLSDFMKGIARAFTATSLGPEPLVDPLDPGFALIQARLNAFKE